MSENKVEVEASNIEVTADGENFTPEFMADVKKNARSTLEDALKAVDAAKMPLVAVFVVENEPDASNAEHNSYCGVNCPLGVADKFMVAGMNILAEGVEKSGVTH